MSLPTITMKGRLTKDIELRYTKEGKAVASFDVASSKTHLNPIKNQWEQVGDTLFLRCELWGDTRRKPGRNHRRERNRSPGHRRVAGEQLD